MFLPPEIRFEFVWKVCRPSFILACPHAPPLSVHGFGVPDNPENACLLRGGTTAAGNHLASSLPSEIRFEFMWKVCRPSFIFACPRAPTLSVHGFGVTGNPEAACPLRGDTTAAGQLSGKQLAVRDPF